MSEKRQTQNCWNKVLRVKTCLRERERERVRERESGVESDDSTQFCGSVHLTDCFYSPIGFYRRKKITISSSTLSADVPPSTVLLNFGVFGCAVSVASGFALSAPCVPDCGADRYLTVGIAATSVIAQVSRNEFNQALTITDAEKRCTYSPVFHFFI